VPNGQSVTLPAPSSAPVEGYAFAGWMLADEDFEDGQSEEPAFAVSPLTPTKVVTLIAVYTDGSIYTANPAQTPPPSPTSGTGDNDLPGDANCDGQVNAADAAAILRYLVQLGNLSEQGKKNAKLTQPLDTPVSAADAARILRWLVELITDLRQG